MSSKEKTFLSLMINMTLITGLVAADASTTATIVLIVLYSAVAALFVSVD